MLFHSYIFIFAFLPVTLGIFYLLQKFARGQFVVHWLVAASLFFYGWWNPVYLILIGGSVIFNFVIAQKIAASKHPRLWLIAGITTNLALLAWFKYAVFLAGIIDVALAPVILPLAISFFTFQNIAFLCDVAKGETRPARFIDYCLFVTFFPQLLAGPIVRHNEMMPQFADKKLFGIQAQNLMIGLTFFIIGLFKKLIIADNLSLLSAPVFTAADQGMVVTFQDGWTAVLAYSLQIYFDFSAYTDMAMGLALMFGIQLPINFFSPYKSASLIEFWRRWHMTLSRFLRDYLYIPLGGRERLYTNILITMIIGGLWHGAGWNFIIWGGLHGLFLIINHAWRSLPWKPFASPCGRIVAVIITFAVVTISWVFFRAETFDGAMMMLQSLIMVSDISASDIANITLILTALIIVFAAPNTAQFIRPTIIPDNLGVNTRLQWRPNMVWVFALSVMAVIALLSLTTSVPFLYFQF